MQLLPDEYISEVNESLSLIQKKNGLCFGTDAFLLSAFLRPAPRARAVELGCGNGIVSLLAARRGRFAQITALELQAELAALAERNVALNRLEGCVRVLQCDVREVTAATLGGEVEAVFANPPYMRADSGYASPHGIKQTARHETDGGVLEFAAAAARILKYGGVFYTVYRPDRLETLFAALKKNNFAPKRLLLVQDNPAAAPSMVLTEAKLGGKEGLTVLPTLLLHDAPGDTVLSPAAARVYDEGLL